jgi:tRNA modification GTPase
MSLAKPSEGSDTGQETIVAIATPPGRGGVGIVRISGPAAISIAEKMARRTFKPRIATFTRLHDQSGELIDEGIVLAFEDGASFTGEPVAELQGHGGPIVMQRLVRAALAEGARLARPGEFSERAFLNGRMDLVQAEAIADLIASGSEAAARGALKSMTGEFSAKVDALAGQLRELRIRLEAGIDFPEEELDPHALAVTRNNLEALDQALSEVLVAARRGVRLSQGATVALVGAPNAGKSSLLNALAGEDAAIVTPIPGTTRDVLKVDLELGGLPIRLLDTAGLRETGDLVEMEGVRRARALLAGADLVVVVHDGSQETVRTFPSDWLSEVKRSLTVMNKLDLVGFREDSPNMLWVSARTGEGLERLVEVILDQLGYQPDGSAFTARQRHVSLLENCGLHVRSTLDALEADFGMEIVAEELRLAHRCLGEIVGQVSADELLGDIFSTFCIGK